MSHITKLIIRILMNRLEIGQEQCGFVKDTRTRNAIIMFIMISERTIKMQNEFYPRFIDNAKVFDKYVTKNCWNF